MTSSYTNLVGVILICWLSMAIRVTLAGAPLLHRGVADAIPNNYIVVLKQNDTRNVQKSLSVLRTSLGQLPSGYRGLVRDYQNLKGLNAFHVELDKGSLDMILDSPLTSYVIPDGPVQLQRAPPPFWPQPRADVNPGVTWGLGRISHRSSGIVTYDTGNDQTWLYVLDTGIRTTHKEFGGRAIWGTNFISGESDDDENGHGTHTASTAAGNTVGVDNTTIPIAVKCLNKNSAGTWSGVIAAMDWAVGDAGNSSVLDRSVINMSIGGPAYPILDQAVEAAVNQGVTVVVAASNYGQDACNYSPARSPSAISVAAIDRSDSRPYWSNYGSCVDVFAPGVDIPGAWKDDDISYASLSGTSMASPHIAGLATWLMRKERLSGAAAVRQRIQQLATPNMVQSPGDGSPNLIAFNGAGLDQ